MKIMKKILPISTLLLIILVICPHAYSSDIYKFEQVAPNPIKKIVKALAKGNIFILNVPEQTTPFVTAQEQNYTQLERLATSDELEDLILHHKNAVVRLYAFKALTKQMHNLPENIMLVINNDNNEVEYIDRNKKEKALLRVLAQNFLN